MLSAEKIMKILSQEDARQQSLPIQRFVQTMNDSVDYHMFRQIFWRFGEGDFQDLPLVCVCSRDHLQGAQSGYEADRDIILLAEDFVSDRAEPYIIAALVQEIVTALASRAAYSEEFALNSDDLPNELFSNKSLSKNNPPHDGDSLASAPDKTPFNNQP